MYDKFGMDGLNMNAGGPPDQHTAPPGRPSYSAPPHQGGPGHPHGPHRGGAFGGGQGFTFDMFGNRVPTGPYQGNAGGGKGHFGGGPGPYGGGGGPNGGQGTPPVHQPPSLVKMEATLEEIFNGCRKKMVVSRKVLAGDGHSTSTQDKTLAVDIKPGWKNGTKITFEREGDQGAGLIPADVVFILDELPHERFRRDGLDLVTRLTVPLCDALTGFSGEVLTLDNRRLPVHVQQVIHPRFVHIVPCEGMPNPKDSSQRGDLRVEFEVDFPERLSEDQQTLIQVALGAGVA